jgi:alpha-tubulin suppressor-like RCC1 family protein
VTGSDHTLVLTDQGLYACGGNTFGQLGLGHDNDCTTLTPVTQRPPGTIQQVVTGSNHTLVFTDQGLYTCGSNYHGQLGLGHIKDCTTLTLSQNTGQLCQLNHLISLSEELKEQDSLCTQQLSPK